MSECKECERLRAELYTTKNAVFELASYFPDWLIVKKHSTAVDVVREAGNRMSKLQSEHAALQTQNETLRATITGLEEQLAAYQQQVTVEENR